MTKHEFIDKYGCNPDTPALATELMHMSAKGIDSIILNNPETARQHLKRIQQMAKDLANYMNRQENATRL